MGYVTNSRESRPRHGGRGDKAKSEPYYRVYHKFLNFFNYVVTLFAR